MLVTQRTIIDGIARRQTAIDKLKSDYGIIVARVGRTDEMVASCISQVDSEIAGDAEQVIRAFITQKPAGVAQVRQMIASKRPYSPSADGRMAAVMARLGDTPKPASMTSKVPNSLMSYR